MLQFFISSCCVPHFGHKVCITYLLSWWPIFFTLFNDVPLYSFVFTLAFRPSYSRLLCVVGNTCSGSKQKSIFIVIPVPTVYPFITLTLLLRLLQYFFKTWEDNKLLIYPPQQLDNFLPRVRLSGNERFYLIILYGVKRIICDIILKLILSINKFS
jgi:hypothetical protein